MKIQFKKAEFEHQTVLFGWLDEPHVKAFWDNSPDHREDIRLFMGGRQQPSTYFNGMFSYWIGFGDDLPFCLVMTHEESEATAPPEYMTPYLSKIGKTFGLDFCIGNLAFLGKGLAADTLMAFMAYFKQAIEPDVDLFLIDPSLNNLRAIHVYEKAGFRIVTEFTQKQGYFAEERGILMIHKVSHPIHEHPLGLPIEYQQMPEYFDAHNVNEQTEAKNAVIERLLKEQKVKTVLDMTCGTGSQVFYLVERGYEVTGNDFSPALIDIARDKAREMNRNITFIKGDMRTVKIGKFDAVITIFNAIGHLTKADFEVTLKNIRANLKDNGVYIFDIFNLQAITDEIIDDFTMDAESMVNGVTIHSAQHSEIDREKGLLTSHDHYTILKEGCEPEIHINSFSLQIYTAEELQAILSENEFEIVGQYDMDGNDFIADKSLNILTVARKKKACEMLTGVKNGNMNE